MHLRTVLLVVAAAILAVLASAPPAMASKKAQRMRLAEGAIGMNMAFYEVRPPFV